MQRAEILKDGASSIYGSDAVAGVVNVITRRNMDGGEVQFQIMQPEKSGGENYRASAGYGWTFERGSAMVAAEYQLQRAIRLKDRDFLSCPEDYFFDASGNRIDWEDRSINAGTALEGCNFMIISAVDDMLYGGRYVPNPSGATVGPIPGFHPGSDVWWDEGPQAWYDLTYALPVFLSEMAMNKNERISLYGVSEFELDFGSGVTWDTEWLFNRRETTSEGWRQFFPVIGSAGAGDIVPGYSYEGDPDWVSGFGYGTVSRPIMPYPSNSEISIDYYYIATGLEGSIGNSLWTWRVDGSYSRSDGDYSRNSIRRLGVGDIQEPGETMPPPINYFDPGILTGANMDALVAAVGLDHTGNTVYDQSMFTAVVTGDMFNLPAGPVGVALGAEYRSFSINDRPSEISQSGNLWGESSALVTKGSDHVAEAFAEVEVPLFAGLPGMESLSLNASGRVFDYKTSGSSSVWKAGLNWQINPTVRLRSTYGTSYRAPALYELYLGNQTAFLSQLSIDPCVNWRESTNDFVRANCAAAGIPDDYNGMGSSATIVTGGGAGVLEPETSAAWTGGVIFTPEFADFSLSVDYFEMTVKDQVDRLGAGGILGGCYGSPNYPSHFCDLFDRNAGSHPTAPYNITSVRDSYLNVNKQKTAGVDVNFRYDHLFSFGRLVLENESTWVFKDVQRLFDPSLASGYDTDDRNGQIGYPKLVSNLRATLTRDDWSFNWYSQYTRRTSFKDIADEETTYRGWDPAYRVISASRGLVHNLSVMYEQPKWSALVGVRNLFNQKPPYVSSSIQRRGMIPLAGTQYDLYGRSLFARFNYYF